jgi:hypothetical protein
MKIRTTFINGLKQVPKCLDFHVTPCLTVARVKRQHNGTHAVGLSIAIEWGHWAVSIIFVKIYL